MRTNVTLSTYRSCLTTYVERVTFPHRKLCPVEAGFPTAKFLTGNSATLPGVALDFDPQQVINEAVIEQMTNPPKLPKAHPKRKPGRPKKLDDRVHKSVILDAKEADMIVALAKERGISQSHLMRDLILIGLSYSADDVESAA